MSMSEPLEPSATPADGIPAADPGTGAPEPAAGFGVHAEEPDETDADGATESADGRANTPFRTPDPRELGPDPRQ